MKSIGRAEWEVMQYIAEHHPVSVRDVAAHMAEVRGLARTSVLTVMERLRDKGHLTRRRDGRRWMYEPAVQHDDLLRQFVQDFVDTRLQGRLSPFFAYLAEQTEVSESELSELRQLVRDLEQKQTKVETDGEDAS